MSKRRGRVLSDSDDSEIEEVKLSSPISKSKSGSPKKQSSILSFVKSKQNNLLSNKDFFGDQIKIPSMNDRLTPAKRKSLKSEGSSSRNSRKRKLSEAQTEEGKTSSKSGSESTKRRRWNGPRTDAPPMRGLTEIPEGKAGCLNNMRFVITGQLPSLTRDEAADLIKSLGGKVTSAVSGMTRYLVAGSEAGESKMKKATEKGVSIIDEAQLLDLIRTLPGKKEGKSKAKKAVRSKTAIPGSVAGISILNQSGSLAVDYFAPKTSDELIGNQSNIKAIRTYIMSFDGKLSKEGAKFKKRAALVSGPPGIGKSSAVSLVCKECGYDIVELNASDTRSRKELENVIAQSLNTGSIRNYFKDSCLTSKKKKAVVMDEVDGMSSGDRGGITKLIELIKKSRVPIITICNDRSHPKIRTLVNYCTDIRFRRPTANQIAHRISKIADRLGLNIDKPSIEKIASGTHSDIRQVIQLLQFWSCDTMTDAKNNLTFMEVKKKVEQSQKDVTRGPWDVVPQLLSQHMTVNNGIDGYFVDQSIVPLMVFGNYLSIQAPTKVYKARDHSVKQCSMNHLSLLQKGCMYTADFDILDTTVRRTQYYGLMPGCAALSCVAAPQTISQIGRKLGRIDFPRWLGQNSKRNKNRRLMSELAGHMNARSVNSSTVNIASDYLYCLKEKIIKPLSGLSSISKEEVMNVIEIMNDYGLTREDWDSIAELGFGMEYKISSKCKSALTRTCKLHLNCHADSVGSHRKSKAMASSLNKPTLIGADGLALSEDDDDTNDDETSKADDLSNNALIKAVKNPLRKRKKK